MNIGSIYLATRSGTPGPPIAIAGPVILDCTDVYSRQKTPMYIVVQSQSGTNDGCQIRRHIMGSDLHKCCTLGASGEGWADSRYGRDRARAGPRRNHLIHSDPLNFPMLRLHRHPSAQPWWILAACAEQQRSICSWVVSRKISPQIPTQLNSCSKGRGSGTKGSSVIKQGTRSYSAHS